jgi:hypothetical protein
VLFNFKKDEYALGVLIGALYYGTEIICEHFFCYNLSDLLSCFKKERDNNATDEESEFFLNKHDISVIIADKL